MCLSPYWVVGRKCRGIIPITEFAFCRDSLVAITFKKC